MISDRFPSKLLESAVDEFSKLPGIGRKTALRLVLHLLKKEESEVEGFSDSILKLKKNICHCSVCQNISDADICSICSNESREKSVICVVENVKDVMSIENTNQYIGVYHVLGGVISPMDGVGPSDLAIDSLKQRVEKGEVNEVILALSTTMEGDTTNFYIYRQLSEFDVKITTLARGVSIGGELEYTDELTLGRSIINRTDYSSSLSHSK